MAKKNVKQEGNGRNGILGKAIASILGSLAFLAFTCTILPKITAKLSDWLYRMSLRRANKKRDLDYGPVIEKTSK